MAGKDNTFAYLLPWFENSDPGVEVGLFVSLMASLQVGVDAIYTTVRNYISFLPRQLC